MPYLNHNLPFWDCYIRNEFLFNNEKGHGEFTNCQVHSVASIVDRTPLFEALLDNGVNWTRRPLNAFCWKKNSEIESLDEMIYWNCFSPYIDVQIRNRLIGLRAELIKPDGVKKIGEYMFTLDWSWESKSMTDFSLSETYEHKCAHLFKVETGNFYAYPNNRIIWFDDNYISKRIEKNPGYIIDNNLYSVENSRNLKTNEEYFYGKNNLKEGGK